MKATHAPHKASTIAGSLVLIWSEVALGRMTGREGLVDTINVMNRHLALPEVEYTPKAAPVSEPAPEAEPEYSEPRATYERMRNSGRKPNVRFN